MKRSIQFVLVVAAAILPVSCGKAVDASNPTGPSSPPLPFSQTIAGIVSSNDITQHSITVPRDGTMTLELTWGKFADLDLYLTNPMCSGYPPADCPMVAKSVGVHTTEGVTGTVTAGESFKAYVDNHSTLPQNYSIRFTVR